MIRITRIEGSYHPHTKLQSRGKKVEFDMDLRLNELMGSHSVLSMESLAQKVAASHEAYLELSDATWKIDQMMSTIDQLIAIRQCVKLYGCTESIQYLYGENNITLSVEGIGEKIASGLKAAWNKIVEWFNKAINFFKKLLGLSPKKKEAFQEVKKELDKNKEKVEDIEQKKQEEKQEPPYKPKYVTHAYLNSVISDMKSKSQLTDPTLLEGVLDKLDNLDKELAGPIWEKPSTAEIRKQYCDVGVDLLVFYELINTYLTYVKNEATKHLKKDENDLDPTRADLSKIHNQLLDMTDHQAHPEEDLKKYQKLTQLYPKITRKIGTIITRCYNAAAKKLDVNDSDLDKLFTATMRVGRDSDAAIRIG